MEFLKKNGISDVSEQFKLFDKPFPGDKQVLVKWIKACKV